MAIWKHTLKLRDVFHDETLSFEERRNEIVMRVRNSSFYGPTHWELSEIVENLETSVTEEEFNDTWDDFYDYADDHRIWVETF